MKTSLRKNAVATAMLLSAASLASAQSTEKEAAPAAQNLGPRTVIAYKAPLRGAPATRVGGGTRSLAAKPVALSVLAPNETGYTTREKPTLYWYVSEPVSTPVQVELTLASTSNLEEAAKPALEITLQPPMARGVHAISLEQYGVSLKPGVEYQWFVALVADEANRSADVVAGGSIKRIAASDAVRASAGAAKPAERAAAYAGEGIWYDAIEQLSQAISADPANGALREDRSSLLEQVGLAEAAAYDRAPAR